MPSAAGRFLADYLLDPEVRAAADADLAAAAAHHGLDADTTAILAGRGEGVLGLIGASLRGDAPVTPPRPGPNVAPAATGVPPASVWLAARLQRDDAGGRRWAVSLHGERPRDPEWSCFRIDLHPAPQGGTSTAIGFTPTIVWAHDAPATTPGAGWDHRRDNAAVTDAARAVLDTVAAGVASRRAAVLTLARALGATR